MFSLWLKVIFTQEIHFCSVCFVLEDIDITNVAEKLKTFLSFINNLKINGKNTLEKQINSEKGATKHTFKLFINSFTSYNLNRIYRIFVLVFKGF